MQEPQHSAEDDYVLVKRFRTVDGTFVTLQVTECPSEFFPEVARPVDRTESSPNTTRTTLDRGMRVNNRSRKQAKQWRTSHAERRVLYTTGG